jgi:uncharacterized protein (DUF58 family)
MFVPSRKLVVLSGVAAAAATLGTFVPALSSAAWALDGLLAALALGDALLLRGKRVRMRRNTGRIWSLGRPNPVQLSLYNDSPRTLTGTVSDDPVAHAHGSAMPVPVTLPSRRELLVRYEVTPEQRGSRALSDITVRYQGPLGLLRKDERVAVPQTVDVYPDVHAARALEMLRRQGRKDARTGSMRSRGGDTEFERLRPVQRGDQLRHVDWRATARREDLAVRQFQTESNQNVVFAVDLGRTMREQHRGYAALDWALNAALLSADVALRGGDRAGLLTFNDEPRRFIKPMAGKRGAASLIRAVYDLDATLGSTDYPAAMSFLKSKLKARSLIIIMTRVLEPRAARELANAVRLLLPVHLPLCLFFRERSLHQMAADPAQQESPYARAAAAEALSFHQALMRRMRRDGVLVYETPAEDATSELVRRYMEIKARRLL